MEKIKATSVFCVKGREKSSLASACHRGHEFIYKIINSGGT